MATPRNFAKMLKVGVKMSLLFENIINYQILSRPGVLEFAVECGEPYVYCYLG